MFDNHDNPRMDARYGDGVHNTEIERVIATVLFASRGASLFYNGDEIGMKTTPPERKEDVKDPVGVTGWPAYKGRDGERTPMQWDDSSEAGFTKSSSPWLPVPPTYQDGEREGGGGRSEFDAGLVQGAHRVEEEQPGDGARAECDARCEQCEGTELDAAGAGWIADRGGVQLHRRCANGET